MMNEAAAFSPPAAWKQDPLPCVQLLFVVFLVDVCFLCVTVSAACLSIYIDTQFVMDQ